MWDDDVNVALQWGCTVVENSDHIGKMLPDPFIRTDLSSSQGRTLPKKKRTVLCLLCTSPLVINEWTDISMRNSCFRNHFKAHREKNLTGFHFWDSWYCEFGWEELVFSKRKNTGFNVKNLIIYIFERTSVSK